MTRDYAQFHRDYPNPTTEQVERNAWRYDTDWVNRARLTVHERRLKTAVAQLIEPIVTWIAATLDRLNRSGKRSAPISGPNTTDSEGKPE